MDVPNFGRFTAAATTALLAFALANGGPRRRLVEVMLERPVRREVIVCDFTGETVDPKVQKEQLKF